MTTSQYPPGTHVSFPKPELQILLERLKQRGFRTIGPLVGDGAVVYGELESVSQLPIGLIDEQDGGHYRLKESGSEGYFDYVVGPHSLKNYLFPPRETVQELTFRDGEWRSHTPVDDGPPLAVIGVRGCDLHGLAVQDRVFLGGPYVDPAYRARREQLFLVAINCRRAAATCFCHSMNTGPAAGPGADLVLTELDEMFVLEVGSDRGSDVIDPIGWPLSSPEETNRAREISEQLAALMHQRSDESAPAESPRQRQRHMDTTDIRNLLLGNLEHHRWTEVAERCLACANCTMVCPTCFCSTVEEVADLRGENVSRERTWASCFSSEHSYTSSGVVRPTIRSQYRQWLTHKLASWIDQFGTSGCIGCGRCITWCPVGIDLTEEVAAIRGDATTC